LDYVWKAPNLIENELKIEMEKIKTYYPDNKELRQMRWSIEGPRLLGVFPYLINNSTLFIVLSILETRVFYISKLLEPISSQSLNDFRGQGISKCFEYLKKGIGIKVDSLENWMQIDASLEIRNCLIHTNGILDYYKSADKIIKIEDGKLYLTKEDRVRRKKINHEFDEMSISNSDFYGKRLLISSKYSWIICVYARDFFDDLCDSLIEKLKCDREFVD